MLNVERLRTTRRGLLNALAALTPILVLTGVFLIFTYRPSHGVERVSQPSFAVDAIRIVHAIASYAFVVAAIALVVVVFRLAWGNDRPIGVVTVSGLALFFVTIGLIITGRRLPWSSVEFLALSFAHRVTGIFGIPKGAQHILVGGSSLTPDGYQLWGAFHVAILPLFAVFASWWFIGASSPRRLGLVSDAVDETTTTAAARVPIALDKAVYGSDDPEIALTMLDAFTRVRLGQPIVSVDFTVSDSVVVTGVTLADGRPVVVKIFPPRTSHRFLDTMQEVQTHLRGMGFPAPMPLVPATPMARGVAVVDEHLHAGQPADGRDPAVRAAMAQALVWIVRNTTAFVPRRELSLRGILGPRADNAAFPTPERPELDFDATASGAEWIDDLAIRARSALAQIRGLPGVVAPAPFSARDLRVQNGQIVGAFGWDRLVALPEALVVGQAACQFTSGPDATYASPPTLEEARSFLVDYERARGAPFSPPERLATRAAYAYATAYAARCEHAMAVQGLHTPAAAGVPAVGGFRERLAAHGPELLA